MTVEKETIEKIKQYLLDGKTQEEVAELAGVSDRSIRRWKKKGYFKDLGRGAAKLSQSNDSTESASQDANLWSDITAADLAKAGFIRGRVHLMVAALGISEQQGNSRLPRFLKAYIELGSRWNEMPEGWRAALAGLPIVAEDIQSPSLIELMRQARRIHPYLSKETRREYHRVARNLLVGILAEVQSFLQDATMFGGFPLALIPEPPAWMPWNKEKSFRADNQLEKGKWSLLIPAGFEDKPFEKTWAGVLFDIISRLPDPDRQRGKLRKKWQLTGLLYLWCSTAPQDFVPSLPKIERRSKEGRKGTLAEAYYEWAESK
jgi:hypothetical protein